MNERLGRRLPFLVPLVAAALLLGGELVCEGLPQHFARQDSHRPSWTGRPAFAHDGGTVLFRAHPVVLLPPVPDGQVCEMYGADRASTSSTSCLGCHDGSVAQAITGEALFSHPTDVDYAERQLQSHGRLHAVLPPELVLMNGRLTCLTCHDGDSPEPAHTALPMGGSAMCFACHDL